VKTRKVSANAYLMHDILCRYVGKMNSISANNLAIELGFLGNMETARRKIRKIKREINSIDSPFFKKILAWRWGYYVAEEGKTREDTIEQYTEYTENRKKTAFTILEETYHMDKHSHLEGQTRLPLSEYMKTIVEIGVAAETDDAAAEPTV